MSQEDSYNHETFVDATTEELLVIVELLGLPALPGLGVASHDEMSPTGSGDGLRMAALESLRARSIVDPSANDRVDPSVAEVLTIMTRPGLLIAASVERGGRIASRYFAAMPEVAIEQKALSFSLLRFTPFASRDVLARTFRFVDLRPYQPSCEHRLTLQQSVFGEVERLVSMGDTTAAEKAISANGNPVDASRAFVSALVAKRCAISVTVVHRPSETAVLGGSLSWIDAGMAGLWVTEPVENHAGYIAIAATSARSIAAELLRYLPDEFANYPAVV